MSERASRVFFPRDCSGLMYAGVPGGIVAPVSGSSRSISAARLKSSMKAWSSLTWMLTGLMFR